MNKYSSFNILIILLSLLIVSLGLGGQFIFDDIANIVSNNYLEIKSLEPIELVQASFSGNSGPLKRPLAYFIFSLTIYIFGKQTFYFELINMLLHSLNALLVYYAIKKILLFTKCEVDYKTSHVLVIGISIWFIHPINSSSIFVAVQLMNVLSATFFLLGLNLYLTIRARNSDSLFNYFKALFFATITSFIGALSKENCLLLLPVLIVLEKTIISSSNNQNRTNSFIFNLSAAILVLSLVYIITSPPQYFVNAYSHRDFTLAERLLTQTRVIFYYIYLFLNPISQEFSLFHDDFTVSENLFQPVTTFIALSLLIVITTFTLKSKSKFPLLSFSWLFFITTHLMESSIFPLELVFEHRNYIPSIGLALGLFTLITAIVKNNKIKNYLIYSFLTLTFTGALISNLHWRDNITLLLKFSDYHPYSERVNFELGRLYLTSYESSHFNLYYDSALHYFNKSLATKNSPSGYFGLLFTYNSAEQDIPKEVKLGMINSLKAKPISASTSNFIQNLTWCIIKEKCKVIDRDFMLQIFDTLEAQDTLDSIKARIMLSKGDYLSLVMGEIDAALAYYALASKLDPKYLLASYRLYETYLKIGNKQMAEKIKDIIIKNDTFKQFEFE
jgi:hypothetical protein